MITAPYNFVPLNKEVFYPSWAEDVSHDVPFADGESGEIDITITAKSPIFIRNHSDDKENPTTEFCHHINTNGAKEFYIPGSSFKGMIRSVLEIMSFSKIKISEEHKNPLSVRDMTNQRELVGTAKGCGFLVKNGDSYQILDCGKILTISHFDLPSTYKGIKQSESAKAKYENFGMNEVGFTTYKKMMKVGQKEIPKDMAKIDQNSKNRGTLVFTGDIGNKKHEFVFKSTTNAIPLDKKVFSDFSKAYFENKNSIDGQYWKEKFKNPKTKIPIFYIKNEKQEIVAIGLTQLFKLAYKKSLFDAAQQVIKPNQLDLAETIFGTEKDKLALKGRVQFSHLKSTTERYEKQVDAILGSPNPTYYPNYIRQTNVNGNKVNKYITLMDEHAEIAGWKRYPLHSETMPSGESSDKEAVKTHFKPLPSETVFEGKLRFHNLKKAEIGALLSAITFHGNTNCMHNIGMAKPLGYGKIEIKLTPKNLKYSQTEYLQEFENMMNSKIPGWVGKTQLRELFAMANVHTKPNTALAYQLLENPKPKYDLDKRNPEKNDFTGAKKVKEYLLLHSATAPKSPQNVNNTPKQNTQIKPEKTQVKKHAENKTPQVSETPNGISKTKMRNAITESWQRVFNIFYHPNQIKEFFEGEFKTTPPEQAKIYTKLKEHQRFVAILKEIERFNKNELNEIELARLYKIIVDLK